MRFYSEVRVICNPTWTQSSTEFGRYFWRAVNTVWSTYIRTRWLFWETSILIFSQILIYIYIYIYIYWMILVYIYIYVRESFNKLTEVYFKGYCFFNEINCNGSFHAPGECQHDLFSDHCAPNFFFTRNSMFSLHVHSGKTKFVNIF